MTKVFGITGKADEIFGVGFRPALIAAGIQFGVDVLPTNVRSESLIRVLVSGEAEDIEAFYNIVKTSDIRVKKTGPPNYHLAETKNYDGPEIDWNRYNIKFMATQMYTGFGEAKGALDKIANEFVKLDQKYDVIGKKATSMDEKLGDIGEKLNSLDSIEKDIKEMNTTIGTLASVVRTYLDHRKS